MKTIEKTTSKIKTISTELLNEISLLVVSANESDEYHTASVHYENNDEIIEKKLAILTPETMLEHNDKIIAIFKKTGKVIKKNKLVAVYDLTNQEFVSRSDMYLHYEANKQEGSFVKQLTPKRK